MKLAAYTIGGIDRASSRLRSFYLFGEAQKFHLDVIRPANYLDALRCDVVHIQKILSYPLIFSIIIYRLFGLKVIYDIDDQPETLKQFLGYWVVLFLSSIICVDTEERKLYWGRYFSCKKIIVVNDIADSTYLGLKASVRACSLDENSFFWVGYSCNLPSIKKFIDYVEKSSNLRLVVSVERDAIEFLEHKYPFVEFIPWYEGVAQDNRITSKFMLLNHDYDEASLMKSDNKMVLAILAGFIPIISRTPAYSRLASNLGVEFLLFDDINQVENIVKNLREADFSNFFDKASSFINLNYSREIVLKNFLKNILSR